MATAFAIVAAPSGVSSVATTSTMSALGSTDDATLSSSVSAVSPGILVAARARASRVVRSASIVARRLSTESVSRVWSGLPALSKTIRAVAR